MTLFPRPLKTLERCAPGRKALDTRVAAFIESSLTSCVKEEISRKGTEQVIPEVSHNFFP